MSKTVAKEKKRLAIYIVEDKDTALFHYQCENVVKATEKSQKWQVMWSLKNEIEKIRKYLDRASLVVILRQTAKDQVLVSLIREAQEKGVRVVMMLDDLVFSYKDLPILMRSTGRKDFWYWWGYCWGVRRIAKKVDGFIATNDYLGKKLEDNFDKPYGVIRNSLSEAQVKNGNIAKKISRKEKFTIGYFSGSPTHEKDLMVAMPEIVKFLQEHEDVVLEVVGYMKFFGQAQELVKVGKIKTRPVVKHEELVNLMAEVDVNIAPLAINDFTNCKSELKFFEAGVVGTTTIASPTYVFEKAIRNGENGLLAREGEWYEKLEYLYEHPGENVKIGKRAKEDALKHYYGAEVLQEIEKTYGKLSEVEV